MLGFSTQLGMGELMGIKTFVLEFFRKKIKTEIKNKEQKKDATNLQILLQFMKAEAHCISQCPSKT